MSPEYWKTPEGKKVAAVVASLLLAGGAACGDDDGGDEATGDRQETTTSQQTTTSSSDGQHDVLIEGDVSREFAGVVEGTDIYASVVLTESEDGEEDALVYLCDGGQVAQLLTRDEGEQGDEFQLSNANDSRVTVTIEGDQVTGTGTLADGTEVSFTLPEIDANGEAGFYIAPNEDVGGGVGDYGAWIVLPDGTQKGNIVIQGNVQAGGQLNVATGTVTQPAVPVMQVRSNGIAIICID